MSHILYMAVFVGSLSEVPFPLGLCWPNCATPHSWWGMDGAGTALCMDTTPSWFVKKPNCRQYKKKKNPLWSIPNFSEVRLELEGLSVLNVLSKSAFILPPVDISITVIRLGFFAVFYYVANCFIVMGNPMYNFCNVFFKLHKLL